MNELVIEGILDEKETTESEYRFPNENSEFIKRVESVSAVSDDKLIDYIKALRNKSERDEKEKEPYSKIRNDFCAVHCVLDQRNLIAPAFRGLRRLTNHIHLTETEKLLSKDRMVIDLHYLHCNYRDEIIPKRGKYKPILIKDDFDFSLASEFACEKWKARKKIESLNITENIQRELLTLKTKKVAEQLRRLPKALSEFETAIYEHAAKPRSRMKRSDIAKRIDEFHCLKLANGSPTEAVKYWSKITGKKVDHKLHTTLVKRFSERIIWINENLPISV